GFAVSGTIDLQSPLPDLSNSIVIQGPGAGSLTVERAAEATFASAIVTVDPGQTAGLSGLTITKGNAGGIANRGGALTVSGCPLSGIPPAGWGVAFFGAAGLVIRGGSYPYSPATLTVRDSQFIGNSAVGGGAIYNGGMMAVRGSTFSGNTASIFGGGLENDGMATLQECSLSGNTAGTGGGIFNGAGTLAVKDSTVTGNSAPAGADLFFFGAVTLDDSTVGVWSGG